MENYNCEECNYRRKDVTLCFPCMMQILAERRKKNRMNRNNEVRFEIVEHIAVLTEQPTGWKKELNLVAWNDREPKYDIRDWDPEHERMSKGITLLPEEMHRIVEAVVDKDFAPRDAAKENIER